MGLMDAIGRMLHISRNLNRGHPNVSSEDFNKAYDRVEELIAAKDARIASLEDKAARLGKRLLFSDIEKSSLEGENAELRHAARGGNATNTTAEMLHFLADRLEKVYGESPNVDFVRCAHERANMLDRALSPPAPREEARVKAEDLHGCVGVPCSICEQQKIARGEA